MCVTCRTDRRGGCAICPARGGIRCCSIPAIAFHQVLLVAWVAAVGCLALGLLLFGLAIASGRTLYPRWAALVLNPVSLALVGTAVPYLTLQPVRTWLAGAAFNIAWLVAHNFSTAVLWRATAIPSPADDVTGASA